MQSRTNRKIVLLDLKLGNRWGNRSVSVTPYFGAWSNLNMSFQRFYRGCINYLGLLSVTMHNLFMFYFSRVYLLNRLRYLNNFFSDGNFNLSRFYQWKGLCLYVSYENLWVKIGSNFWCQHLRNKEKTCSYLF